MSVPDHRGDSEAAPSAVALAIRRAARFDRSALSLRAGLVAAIPVAGVLGAGTLAGQTVAAVTAGAGAMLVGMAWRATGGMPPVATMVTDTAVMGLSTFAGAASGHLPRLHLVLLVAWAAAAGLIVAVGRRTAVVGTQAIIAFVVFGRFSQPIPGAAELAGLVAAGGVVQVLFSALFGAPPALRVQRSAVAEAYRRLALVASDPSVSPGVPAAALDEAERKLEVPTLLGDAATMSLSALVQEGRRLRLELAALSLLLAQYGRERGTAGTALHRATARMRESAAATLRCVAAVVEGAAPAAGLNASLEAVQFADAHSMGADSVAPAGSDSGRPAPVQFADAHSMGADSVAPAGSDSGRPAPVQFADAHSTATGGSLAPDLADRIERHAAALAGQVRAAAGLTAAAQERRGRITVRPSLGSTSLWQRLTADLDQIRANASLHSPAGRHALRLAVIVPATELLSQHLPLQRGYWIVVAAATVLRPDFGGTFTRGVERMAGTSVGVILAGLLAVALHPTGWATVALVGILACGAYAIFPASFAAGVAFLSAMIVFLLEAVAPSTLATATDRGIDTIIGGAIALLAYALWPTWSRQPARQALSDLVTAQRDYIRAVLEAVIDGRSGDQEKLRALARRARLAWTKAEATLEQSLAEPPGRQIDIEQARRVMTGLRRIIQAAHVIRLEPGERAGDRALAALRPLAEGLDRTLEVIAEAFATGAPDRTELPSLRALHRALVSGAADVPDRVLLTELDEMVDAANTVTELLGLGRAAPPDLRPPAREPRTSRHDHGRPSEPPGA